MNLKRIAGHDLAPGRIIKDHIHVGGTEIHVPREEIDSDKADVINIMKYLGLLKGGHKEYTHTQLLEHEWLSPATGCWYPEYHAGDAFRAGDKLGMIRDYFGKTIAEITVAEAGIIIHQCASLNIVKDGPMISYGTINND